MYCKMDDRGIIHSMIGETNHSVCGLTIRGKRMPSEFQTSLKKLCMECYPSLVKYRV